MKSRFSAAHQQNKRFATFAQLHESLGSDSFFALEAPANIFLLNRSDGSFRDNCSGSP